MASHHLSKICVIEITRSQYTIEILEILQLKHLDFTFKSFLTYFEWSFGRASL